MPYHKPKATREYIWGRDAPSRKAVVNRLEQEYMRFDHKWASTTVRDHAFECFLNIDHDRLKQLIQDYKFSSFSAGSGLLMEPFVHKLLTETDVSGDSAVSKLKRNLARSHWVHGEQRNIEITPK